MIVTATHMFVLTLAIRFWNVDMTQSASPPGSRSIKTARGTYRPPVASLKYTLIRSWLKSWNRGGLVTHKWILRDNHYHHHELTKTKSTITFTQHVTLRTHGHCEITSRSTNVLEQWEWVGAHIWLCGDRTRGQVTTNCMRVYTVNDGRRSGIIVI